MSVTLLATADTYLSEAAPTTSYNTAATLKVGLDTGKRYRGLMKFGWTPRGMSGVTAAELAALLADCAASTVTLNLYASMAASTLASVLIDRVVRVPVFGATGAGADWNTYNGANAWGTAGCGNNSTDYTATGEATFGPLTTTPIWYTADIKTQFLASDPDDGYFCRLVSGSEASAVWALVRAHASGYEPHIDISATLNTPDVTATPGDNGAVALAWTAITGASGYAIYRGGTATPTRVIAIVDGAATSFTDTVMPGVYYYRVQATSNVWTDSALSVVDMVTATSEPVFALNFGNGIIVRGTAAESYPRMLDYSGLDFPDVEVGFTQNAIQDGGRYVSSRASGRTMAAKIDFGATLSRYEAAALFRPGAQYWLSSPRGSMPYSVTGLTFDGAVASGDTIATVTMVSEYAYPEGKELSEVIASGSDTIITYTDVAAPAKMSVTIPADVTDAEQVIFLSAPGMAATVTPIGGGTFAAGDVIVVDRMAWEVWQNDLNAISVFDRTGYWPMLYPPSVEVAASIVRAGSVTQAVPVTVTWRPRLMGLML